MLVIMVQNSSGQLVHTFNTDDDKVKILGRTKKVDNMLYFNYTCSGIEFEFTGNKLSVVLCTSNYFNEDDKKAWVGIFINDEEIPCKRFMLEDAECEYTIYESTKTESVKIKILKLSECAFEKCAIKAILTDSTGIIKALKEKKRKIEFIGDSITCGYGCEGKLDVDTFTTAHERAYETFASRTARYFDADYNCISWSGIGIISSYTDTGDINNELLMPTLYKYTDADMDKRLNCLEKDFEIWDNNKFKPDLIVVNLGTNDFSYTKDIKAKQKEFEKYYYDFISQVRKSNRDSQILCTLGVMGDELYEFINNAVNDFKREFSDSKIHAMRFEKQKEEDGIGTDCHPSLKTHEKMADQLIKKIKDILGW